MKFLKRIKTFLIYSFLLSFLLSIIYIPHTSFASWSGSAYSPGETLNPECAPTDSGCTVSLSFTASSGNIGIGSTTPWGKLSVNPNGITGPAFVVGSSTATSFVVTNGGMVGIGTSIPTYVLEAKALSGVNALFKIQNSDYNSSDTGTALTMITGASSGNSYVRLQAYNNGGSSAGNIVLNSSGGNVGVGTTSPYAKLSVTNTSTSPSFLVEDSTSPDTTPFIIDNSGNVGIGTSTPFATLAINPTAGNASNQFVIGSSTATSFVVDNGGRVGIGITNPLEELHIVDTTSNAIIYADSYSGGTGSFIGRKAGGTISAPSAVTVSDSLVSIGGRGYGSTGFSASSRGVINIRPSETWTDTAQGTIIAFETTQNNTTSRSQKMVIDGTGHLGIATTSPYAKLSVTGTGVGTTTFALRPIASQTANIVDIYTSAGVLKDVVSSANLWGLGTSSPSSKLSLTQSANTPAGGLWIAETGNTDFRSIYMSDTSGTLSFFGGDTAGALNTATLSSAGTWTNASDRSYKENITNLDTKYNLNTLLSIQPRFYTMKGSGKPQIGFIAQELQPILPEVVEGTEGSLGISYGNMVALLVQAIKDINTKVDGLATTIKDQVKGMFVEKVETKRLCLDGLCVTRDELQRILYTTNVNGVYEQTIPSSTDNQQNNNSNNPSNNSLNNNINPINQNTQNNSNGTSTEQTNNSTTTPQSSINPDTKSNDTQNNTQTNKQPDNTQGSTTPATIPETLTEQPVVPQVPDTSSSTPNTLPEQAN